MKVRWVCVAFVIVMLNACSKPLPESKKDYVGEWHGDNMLLVMTQAGQVTYERKRGNSNVSIDAPIQEFVGDDFIVGFAWFTTRFEVSHAPAIYDGEWQMTVDDVLLTKVK